MAAGQVPKFDFFIKLFAVLSVSFVVTLTIIVALTNDVNKGLIFFICGVIGLGFNAFVPFAC